MNRSVSHHQRKMEHLKLTLRFIDDIGTEVGRSCGSYMFCLLVHMRVLCRHTYHLSVHVKDVKSTRYVYENSSRIIFCSYIFVKFSGSERVRRYLLSSKTLAPLRKYRRLQHTIQIEHKYKACVDKKIESKSLLLSYLCRIIYESISCCFPSRTQSLTGQLRLIIRKHPNMNKMFICHRLIMM